MVCVLCGDNYFVEFFFFKQKTAYEMRISDWSSDVCSSDLQEDDPGIIFLPARLLMVAFGVACVWMTWRIGKRLGGDRVGLVAAAILAVNAVHEIGRASCRERVCQYV